MTPEDFVSKLYDFVIIAGGTVGLTLAARLTEEPAMTVAVLEVGPDLLNDSTTLTSALAPAMFGDPKYDWCHRTVPQASYLSLSTIHRRPPPKNE
jgi:choline dehydrogenase